MKLLGLTRFLVSVLLVFGILLLGYSPMSPAKAVASDFGGEQAIASVFSFSGERPDNLGVKNGKLTPCPTSPNCVSSQSKDENHFIEPFTYKSSSEEAFNRLKNIIEKMENAEIIDTKDNYLYAEFTTQIMGFVDDVEFYNDPDNKTIHLRSASRLGESDLGKNRDRVEKIRAAFEAAKPSVG